MIGGGSSWRSLVARWHGPWQRRPLANEKPRYWGTRPALPSSISTCAVQDGTQERGYLDRHKEVTVETLLRLLIVASCGAVLWLPAVAQSSPTKDEMQALAPTGKLRAALYLGGPTNVVKEPLGRNERRGV